MKTDGQKESLKHEKRLAKLIGGQRSAGSGAFWSRKGDVRNATYLIEHKYTSKKSVTISHEVLKKITKEAILDSRIPVLGLSLGGENFVVLLEEDFLALDNMISEHTCPIQTIQNGLGDIEPSA